MLTVQFAVSGQGQSLFGDGFALWYTKERGELGPALGNTDKFEGFPVKSPYRWPVVCTARDIFLCCVTDQLFSISHGSPLRNILKSRWRAMR